MQNSPNEFHGSPSFEWANTLAITSFFAIGALVYGVFAPFLGFYWDDWPVVWVYNALGPRGVTIYFAGLRPGFGWVIAHIAPILGISPIGWQVAAIAVRCASSAALFVAFCGLWPRRKDIAWLVGTLVLLYPGLTLQPIALITFPHHLGFLLFAGSLATTIRSITKQTYRWLFLPISLLTGGLSYVITEYFVGLELFRFLIIVILTSRECGARDFKKKLRIALIKWSPYAVVWAAYVVWRAFLFRWSGVTDRGATMDVGSQISNVLRSPVREALSRVWGGIHNILMATVFAWVRPFSPNLIGLNSGSVILSLAIATIVVGIGMYMLRRLTMRPQPLPRVELSNNNPPSFPESGFLLGLVGLVVAGLPLAVSGLTATFAAQASFDDRLTLPFMLPASLTLTGLLLSLGSRRVSKLLSVSLMLFAFSAFQVQNENSYFHDWRAQRSLFWQIAWRAPALKQGTSLFAQGLPASLYGNHSAGLLNMLYDRNDSAGRLDRFIFDLSLLSIAGLPGTGEKPSYKLDSPIGGRVREFQFQGNTAQSLVSWISPTGTFRIVSQPYANEILQGSALSLNLSYLSRPEEVISDAPGPPAGPLLKIFGSEPKHEWLYFYQKAELERQLKHWDAVAILGDEVLRQGYKPSDPSEWFPFIDSYAKIRRYRTAADLSNRLLEENPDALAALSSLWLRVKREDLQNSPELTTAFRVLRDKLMLGDSQ